jgi:hypothetical protein
MNGCCRFIDIYKCDSFGPRTEPGIGDQENPGISSARGSNLEGISLQVFQSIVVNFIVFVVKRRLSPGKITGLVDRIWVERVNLEQV